MAVNDVYRVRLQISHFGIASSFQLYYREATAQAIDGDGGPVATAVGNHLNGFLLSCISNTTYYPLTEAYRINQPGFPGRAVNAGNLGSRPGQTIPNNKAVVIRLFQNQLPARRNNRIYLTGFTEADTDGNTVTAPFLAAAQALADALLDQVDNGDPANGLWAPVCRTHAGQPFDLNNYPPLVDATPHPVIYSQAPRTRKYLQFTN